MPVASTNDRPSRRRASPGNHPAELDWRLTIDRSHAGSHPVNVQLQHSLAQVAETLQTTMAGSPTAMPAEQHVRLRGALTAIRDAQRQLRRLTGQLPLAPPGCGVRRRWFSLQSLREAFSAEPGPWSSRTGPKIYWHGFQRKALVFGDIKRTGRLLAGLMARITQLAESDQPLLIQASLAAGGRRALRLSIVATRVRRATPGATATELTEPIPGLNAALLDQAIWKRWAQELMTEVVTHQQDKTLQASFELPLGGPLAVAEFWQQLRLAHVRGNRPRCPHQASLVSLQAGGAAASAALDAFAARVQDALTPWELAYQPAARHWIVLWDCDHGEALGRLEAMASQSLAAAAPLRLRWSNPWPLPIRSGVTARLLGDRLVREQLAAALPNHLQADDDRGNTADRPQSPSAVPARRLSSELSQLAKRISAQNRLLANQAARLRSSMEQPRLRADAKSAIGS